MKNLPSTMRGGLYWAVPFGLLALLILWQTDWGRAFFRVPPAESSVAPQPLTLALLPEYQPAVTPDANRDVVERTLFNPTRRPAPPAVVETAKPRMQRGQFTLAGTLLVNGKSLALLRETAGGKSRSVKQGDSINGLLVAEVQPNRVKLALGDESEELSLKIATGPRTTVQPVVPGAPGGPGTTGAPGAPVAAGQGASAQVRDVAEVLAERRRAARAAEAAAAGLPPGAPIPTNSAMPAPVTGNSPPPPPTVNPNAGDPQWQGVYQRYQQPRR